MIYMWSEDRAGALTRKNIKQKKDLYENDKLLHLDRDRKSVISEGLEAKTARLMGGLPHWHQIP